MLKIVKLLLIALTFLFVSYSQQKSEISIELEVAKSNLDRDVECMPLFGKKFLKKKMWH